MWMWREGNPCQLIRENQLDFWKTVGRFLKKTGRKEMRKNKMAVWGGLTNSCEKKRSEKQRRKGKI